jgi:hypothetical protein
VLGKCFDPGVNLGIVTPLSNDEVEVWDRQRTEAPSKPRTVAADASWQMGKHANTFDEAGVANTLRLR